MHKILKALKVEPENYSLLETIYFAFFASGIMSIMLGTLLPYIRDENALTYAQSGLMLSAHQFGNLCAVLVAGILPYVIGRKKSTLLMGAGTILGLVLMALTRNFALLVAAFALTGIGRGTMSNICNVVISNVSGNKGAALNTLHAVFAVGALLSPVIVFIFARKNDSNWKLAAIFAASLAVAAWALIARSKLSNSPSKKEKGGSFFFLKDLMFWLNTMILFFYLCAEASIIGWFVIYFKDMGILPATIAKFTPTLLWITVMLGRLSCAALSSRIDKNKLLLVLASCFILLFTGMLMSKSTVPLVICLLGIGFSMAGIYPTTFSTIKATSSTIATGFVISIASIGGILMPGIVGAVADIHGLFGGVAMILTALTGMLALIIAKLILVNRQNRKESPL